MKISEAFKDVSRLYMDTSPFIYYTEHRAGFVEKMREIFYRLDAGDFDALTSPITLTETLVKPLGDEDQTLIDLYQTMFFKTDGVHLLDVTPQTGLIAARLRADHNLRTPDALHLACAIEAKCDAFLTNDIKLKRVTALTVLVLDDLEIDPDPEA